MFNKQHSEEERNTGLKYMSFDNIKQFFTNVLTH
jgi:hypothetical protein